MNLIIRCALFNIRRRNWRVWRVETLKIVRPLTDSTLLWLSVFSQGGRFAYFNQQGLDDGVFLSTFRDHWHLIPTTHLRVESLCTHSEIHISLQEKKKKPSRDEYISPSSMLSSSEFARVCFRLGKTRDLKWKQHLLEASDTRGRGEELRVPCTLILQEKTSFCCGWYFILFVVWARLALNSWLTLTGLEVMKDPDCL